MPIPETRAELVEQISTNYSKLAAELELVDDEAAELACVDEWSIRELLAVRAWWTERVVGWIEAGRSGETPTTPAPGYGWRETPRLNADIVEASRGEPYTSIRARLDQGQARTLEIIASLSDAELLEVGAFEWAGGKWPLRRWLSVNTATQYASARKFIRRALRHNNR